MNPFTLKINAYVATNVFKDYEGEKHGDKVAVNGQTPHTGMNDEPPLISLAFKKRKQYRDIIKRNCYISSPWLKDITHPIRKQKKTGGYLFKID